MKTYKEMNEQIVSILQKCDSPHAQYAAQRILELEKANTPHNLATGLTELAVQWLDEAREHDCDGNADCGTGSDVPYALASICRDHAKALERIMDLIK